MWYGAAYYPEHWPEERWATDARLMREAGFNVVRLGEFAWAKMEPDEDRFEFDWLDRAIGILQQEEISVLLGTPTAGPPAWLVNADDPTRDCRMVYENGGVAAPPKERLGEDASAWNHLQRAGTVPVVAAEGPLAGNYAADTWCDHLEIAGTEVEVLARFAEGSPAGGAPAVTCHRFGSGRAIYVAASMEAKLNERLMEWLMGRPAAAPRAESDRVEIVPAEQNSRHLYFVLNHGATSARVALPPGARDALNGTSLTAEMNLEAYDVALITCDG